MPIPILFTQPQRSLLDLVPNVQAVKQFSTSEARYYHSGPLDFPSLLSKDLEEGLYSVQDFKLALIIQHFSLLFETLNHLTMRMKRLLLDQLRALPVDWLAEGPRFAGLIRPIARKDFT